MITDSKILDTKDNRNELPMETIDELLAKITIERQYTEPYEIFYTLSGTCIKWDENFINKLIYAFSTGQTHLLTDGESNVLRDLIEFEELTSTSIPVGVSGAIGCSTADNHGKSYVVFSEGELSTIECNETIGAVERRKIMESLDSHLMKMVNCEEIVACDKHYDLTDISKCQI